MKKLVLIPLFVFSGMVTALAQQDTLFVNLDGGVVDAYPKALLENVERTMSELIITDIGGVEHRYFLSEIVSEGNEGPTDHPWLSVFKFNNKFNDQVYTDVELDLTQGTMLNATVACIGKWLTPSFQCSSDDALVFVGNEQQLSKRTRRRFDTDVTYTVALPGRHVLKWFPDAQPTPEPVPEPADETKEMIPLTIDDLSTNAPSNNPDAEGLEKLMDDNYSTFFHSTWGDGPYEKLPLEEAPWIEAKLPEPVHHLQIYYCTRMDTNGRSPMAWDIQVSADGDTWTTVKSLSMDADGLPEQGEYTSPTIDLGGDFSMVRMVMTAANYKNYLCLAELRFIKVTPNTETPPGGDDDTPEEQPSGHCEMMPFGTEYTVHVDFPTDNAEQVPRIDLVLDGADMVTTKSYYIDCTFSIDGAGVYPDMEPTQCQIKGRGNSSWENPSYFWGYMTNPKNPYRLKFGDKVKPFGLTKGRSWVLLANKLNGSMTTNAIGMKAACIVGTDGANHIVPVELYINGEYRGSYNFTEKTGFHNNSIEVEDETVATFVELDTYSPDADETRFYSSLYQLPVKIKYPLFGEDPTTVTQTQIETSFDNMEYFIKNHQDISDVINVESLAKFYMVNELLLNLELMHPKSTFMYNDNVYPNGKWSFGPVWDLDWCFGHELNGGYYTSGARSNYVSAKSMEKNNFWKDLRQCGEPLDRAIYEVWHDFMEKGGLTELLDFCDEYYAYARPSLEHNADWWGDGKDYATITTQAKKWLTQRAEYVYSHLTPYEIDPEDPEPIVDGIESRDLDEASATRPIASHFDVFDARGLRVRHNADSRTWRDGLRTGLYIVNGKKVLVK